MGIKDALQAAGRALSGGMAGAAAEKLDPAARRAKIDSATSDSQSVPQDSNDPASPNYKSKMVDPKSGIRFKAGGSVDNSIKPAKGDKPLSDAGKAQRVPNPNLPKVGNTVPSSGGYKAGGMVRRGYGKARGA